MKTLQALTLTTLLLVAPAAVRAVTDSMYLGINNNTGFDPSPNCVAQSVAKTKEFGFGSARVGMDGVDGATKNAPFSWGARDAAVEAYLAAGLQVRTVCSPRGHIRRGANFDEWMDNWQYFMRGVMTRYKGKIGYYIIDNEPELSFGQGTLDAEQAIAFTRAAWTIAHEIDPTIRIESPPSNSPEAPILREMIAGGIAQYCDYIGTHIYGAQVVDGRAGTPWTFMETHGVRKPLSASEAGVTARWTPKGFQGPAEGWRQRWLPQYYLSLKRYAYAHSMLFSLTEGEDGWQFLDREFQPVYGPLIEELKTGFRVQPFDNGGFETPNDREHGWQETYDPDLAEPPRWIDFDSATSARSGARGAKMDIGGAPKGRPIIARRIAARVTPGATYQLSAWVKAPPGAVARLKAHGFDSLMGNREASATAIPGADWRPLTVSVVPRASWLVVEVGAEGSGKPGETVLWDDVVLTGSGKAALPAAPADLQATPRPREVSLRWSPPEGATHFTIKRASGNGPLAVIARQVTGSPWADTGLADGTDYRYVVSAGNGAGDGADSSEVRATPRSGSLSAAAAARTGDVNLTAEGNLDWALWGYGGAPGLVRKAGAAGLIGEYRTSTLTQPFGDLPFAFRWEDGTPAASGASSGGVFVFFPGSALNFDVPADPAPRVLKVYVGGFNSRGKLVARLSDGSVPAYTDSSFEARPGGKFSAVYTLKYASANPGQKLNVSWVEDATFPGAEGNVQLQAATLATTAAADNR